MSSHVPLCGSYREHPNESMPAGDPNPDEMIQVSLVLNRRKEAPAAVAFEQNLTHSDLTENHGADPAHVSAVASFAQQYNLSVNSVDPATRIVTLAGPLSDMVQDLRRGCTAIPLQRPNNPYQKRESKDPSIPKGSRSCRPRLGRTAGRQNQSFTGAPYCVAVLLHAAAAGPDLQLSFEHRKEPDHRDHRARRRFQQV